MTAHEHDPILVAVANVLHDQTNEPMWSCVVIARTVLDAVGPLLRREGASLARVRALADEWERVGNPDAIHAATRVRAALDGAQ